MKNIKDTKVVKILFIHKARYLISFSIMVGSNLEHISISKTYHTKAKITIFFNFWNCLKTQKMTTPKCLIFKIKWVQVSKVSS
jgi:hypothetical protein